MWGRRLAAKAPDCKSGERLLFGGSSPPVPTRCLSSCSGRVCGRRAVGRGVAVEGGGHRARSRLLLRFRLTEEKEKKHG